MNSGVNLETLNAYADDELSAAENAEVANAIAFDPELARQVAALSSLKAALTSANCSREEPISLDLPENKKTWLRWTAACAAVLAFGAVIATLILNNNLLLPNEGLQFAEKVHMDWLQEKPVAENRSTRLVSMDNLGQLQIDAYVPDLSKVDLVFSGVRRLSSGKSSGMHIGYQGPKGCKVSLVVLNNTNGLSEELTHFERNGRLLYSWQVKQTGFYLLAYKMDPARLAEVARVVNKLTRERLPLDPRSIIALNEARSSSKSCLA